MASSSFSLFAVTAEADPQLPGRILDLFAQRNVLPARFSARRTASGLSVTVQTDLEPRTCELLAAKILNIPTVLDVVLSSGRAASRPAGTDCHEPGNPA